MNTLNDIKDQMTTLGPKELAALVDYANEINPAPYSVSEVAAAVRETGDATDFWGGPAYYELTLRGKKIKPVEVDSTGGMDEGSQASVIFQVGTQFFRKHGYYASHYGYDWDGDLYEVKPVTKPVTVYERA